MKVCWSDTGILSICWKGPQQATEELPPMGWSPWTIPTCKFTGRVEPFFLASHRNPLSCFIACAIHCSQKGFSFKSEGEWEKGQEGRQLVKITANCRSGQKRCGIQYHLACAIGALLWVAGIEGGWRFEEYGKGIRVKVSWEETSRRVSRCCLSSQLTSLLSCRGGPQVPALCLALYGGL